jgi:hypothetical protein
MILNMDLIMIHKNYLKLGVIWWICNESLYCDTCSVISFASGFVSDISEHQGRWSMWNHKECILEVCNPRWHAFSALFIFRESKWGHRLNQPLPPSSHTKMHGIIKIKGKIISLHEHCTMKTCRALGCESFTFWSSALGGDDHHLSILLQGTKCLYP